MKNRIGAPVRHDDFLERQELDEVWSLAERGNVLLLAPRRVGKTSLLMHMRDEPREPWQCLFLSVESVASEAEFVRRCLTEVRAFQPDGGWKRLSMRVARILPRVARVGPVEFRPPAPQDGWQAEGAVLREALSRLPRHTLILMDEFPIFVRRLLHGEGDVERTRLFLHWFRDLRNHPQLSDAEVHFVLSGSLGLDAVVARVRMTATINDLVPFHLGPLTAELADELLARLAAGENLTLSVDLRKSIRSYITWPIPFHLQLLFGEVLRLKHRNRRDPDETMIGEAYESLLSSENKKHFGHWADRLQDFLLVPEERDFVKAVLRSAARDPNGILRDTIRQIRRKLAPGLEEEAVLLRLERDGYLVEAQGRWRFPSSLLRDWWLRWMVH